MSIGEKIVMTYLILFIPISMYGFWEVKHGKENRWVVLGMWLAGVFIGALHFIWMN